MKVKENKDLKVSILKNIILSNISKNIKNY